MKGLFHNILKNVWACFRGRNLLWQLFAIIFTYAIVESGLDWSYFLHSRSGGLQTLLFPAVIIGSLVPIIAPLTLLAAGKLKKSFKVENAAFALGQAAILGLLISDFYKAFTGRIPPPEIFGVGTIADTSAVFQFGLLRGGVFWGWPSTHTTIAFAMAIALAILFSEKKLVKYPVIAYALYVGIGVSVSIHWFSDFIAGAIMGTVIGIAVGGSFRIRSASGKSD